MSLGDIKVLRSGAFGEIGAKRFLVATTGTAATIKAGEPVAKILTGTGVTPLVTSAPVVGTHYMAGIATSTSTETATIPGVVDVMPLVTNTVYIISPKVAATWDTQAEYDALVGSRVLLDLTAGVYTILAADSANNGCVVEPLDVSKFPGKVAFSIRAGANYLA